MCHNSLPSSKPLHLWHSLPISHIYLTLSFIIQPSISFLPIFLQLQVQRPGALENVSLDIFIMRRAALLFSKLPGMSDKWASALDDWAVRFFQVLGAFSVSDLKPWSGFSGQTLDQQDEPQPCKMARSTQMQMVAGFFPQPQVIDSPLLPALWHLYLTCVTVHSHSQLEI